MVSPQSHCHFLKALRNTKENLFFPLPSPLKEGKQLQVAVLENSCAVLSLETVSTKCSRENWKDGEFEGGGKER